MTSKASSSFGATRKDMYIRDHTEGQMAFGRNSLSTRGTRSVRAITVMDGGEFLSFGQLQKLSEHQGRHVGQSVMEPLMQPLWKKLAELIPNRWSPNAIILAGLFFHSITTFVLVTYCPDARGEAPKWVYCLSALGLAVFFVLDAIDERQAKKTKCHEVLRELFHHFCHAFSNMFLVLGACMTTKMGSHPRLMSIEFFSMLLIFYSVHWQAYCSGIFNFQYLDSMEIQLIVMMLYILSGVFGPSIWDIEILGCPAKILPVLISLVIGYFCCLCRLSIVLIQGGVGKNGSTVAGTSILSPLVPVFMLFFLGYLIASNSQSHVLQRYPVLFLVFLGVPLVKLSCKIVVSHMTRSEMVLFDDIIYIPVMAFIVQKMNFLSDHTLLLMCLIFSFWYLVRYCFKVCQDICNYLKISCFKVIFSPANMAPYPSMACT